MRYAFPCQITRYDDSEFVVSFPDVREANTSGKNRAEALEMAEDALSVALGIYVAKRAAIPVPSPVVDGQEIVAVDPVVAAKLDLYSAMREQGITKRALGRRLGLSGTTVTRLTDLGHRSHIGQVTKALRAVGRSLLIEVRAIPAHEQTLASH